MQHRHVFSTFPHSNSPALRLKVSSARFSWWSTCRRWLSPVLVSSAWRVRSLPGSSRTIATAHVPCSVRPRCQGPLFPGTSIFFRCFRCFAFRSRTMVDRTAVRMEVNFGLALLTATASKTVVIAMRREMLPGLLGYPADAIAAKQRHASGKPKIHLGSSNRISTLNRREQGHESRFSIHDRKTTSARPIRPIQNDLPVTLLKPVTRNRSSGLIDAYLYCRRRH